MLQDRFKEIRDEVLEAQKRVRIPMLHEIEPTQTWETGGRWNTLLLRIYHVDVQENLALFPVLESILNTLPDVPTAMISVLQPGGHIQPHCGYYNGVLRYHLGILVPKVPKPPGRLGIRVADQWSTWTEGGAIMFDDCFEHEVGAERPCPGPGRCCHAPCMSSNSLEAVCCSMPGGFSLAALSRCGTTRRTLASSSSST